MRSGFLLKTAAISIFLILSRDSVLTLEGNTFEIITEASRFNNEEEWLEETIAFEVPLDEPQVVEEVVVVEEVLPAEKSTSVALEKPVVVEKVLSESSINTAQIIASPSKDQTLDVEVSPVVLNKELPEEVRIVSKTVEETLVPNPKVIADEIKMETTVVDQNLRYEQTDENLVLSTTENMKEIADSKVEPASRKNKGDPFSKKNNNQAGTNMASFEGQQRLACNDKEECPSCTSRKRAHSGISGITFAVTVAAIVVAAVIISSAGNAATTTTTP